MELMSWGRCRRLPLYFYPRFSPQPALKDFNLSLCQSFPKRNFPLSFIHPVFKKLNLVSLPHLPPHTLPQLLRPSMAWGHQAACAPHRMTVGDCGFGTRTGTVQGFWCMDRCRGQGFPWWDAPSVPSQSLPWSRSGSIAALQVEAQLDGLCWRENSSWFQTQHPQGSGTPVLRTSGRAGWAQLASGRGWGCSPKRCLGLAL